MIFISFLCLVIQRIFIFFVCLFAGSSFTVRFGLVLVCLVYGRPSNSMRRLQALAVMSKSYSSPVFELCSGQGAAACPLTGHVQSSMQYCYWRFQTVSHLAEGHTTASALLRLWGHKLSRKDTMLPLHRAQKIPSSIDGLEFCCLQVVSGLLVPLSSELIGQSVLLSLAEYIPFSLNLCETLNLCQK